MEYLPNGFTLEIPAGCFPLSTDSMVLQHFVRLPKNARVLDLCSGCGTLGLLLCAQDPGCHVTGIELDGSAHTAAISNIARNGLADRMASICADARFLPEEIPAGSFSVCISNPPYFSGGFASRSIPTARQADRCPIDALCAAAAKALKFGGDFYVVHKPENLGSLIACAAGAGMEAKRLLLLRHRPDSPVNLITLQLRKGGKPGLKIEEAALYDHENNPTSFYREVYHLDHPHT